MTEYKRHFAICVDNTDSEASLILRKIYEIVPDEAAAGDDLLRIIDESGEIISTTRATSLWLNFQQKLHVRCSP